MMRKTIPVVGMACSSCSSHIEKKLNSLNGVMSAEVSLVGRSAQIEYDDSVISLDDMKREINAIGFDLIIEETRSVEEIERREYVRLRNRTILSCLIAILVMAISMRWIDLGSRDIVNQTALLLSLANIVFCGRQFFVNSWKQACNAMFSMDTLVSLSTGVVFLFSSFNTFFGEAYWGRYGMEWHTYFDASVMIITFVLAGRLLEEKAKSSTADSIRKLMGLQPTTARVVIDDNVEEVPLSTVSIGDVLEVRPGDRIPVDGMVSWANSYMTAEGAYVDESMISGEPVPVLKQRGSKVLAGTVLQQGKLRFRASQVGEHTALAQIISMVRQAQSSKAPMQRIVDKTARVFVPVVVSLSVVTFLAWWLFGGNSCLPQAILSAVSVLVIACPCAMGLATPTALMVGIGKAAQKNILIKDAGALEKIRNINAMVIDKTGTLTIPNQTIDFTKADSIPYEEREQLKPHVTEAIAQLNDLGIEVFLMSGDKDDAVRYWAEKAGISNYQSKVLPDDKASLVRRLQENDKVTSSSRGLIGKCFIGLRQKRNIVAMVGDGINDTQALALADVSIAMGTGTDVAMDVAQMTLMSDDLRRLPEAVRLSRKTVSMIWQNLFWAFIYNIVCIPLAAGLPYAFGIHLQITPMWGSALMAFSSLSVILNSLRLKLVE